MEYTAELYKRDRRLKQGERLISKQDHQSMDRATLKRLYSESYPITQGYRLEIHETWVTRVNLMGGAEYRERYDTPRSCSPSSEAYWSM
jgi:hypothetical protein